MSFLRHAHTAILFCACTHITSHPPMLGDDDGGGRLAPVPGAHSSTGGDSGASPDGGPTTLAPLQASPRGLALDSTTLYWTTGDNKVMRVSRAGGPSSLVATASGPGAIAVLGTTVIWAERGSIGSADGAIRSAFKEGGDAVTLASNLSAPYGLIADTTRNEFDFTSVGAGTVDVSRALLNADGSTFATVSSAFGFAEAGALVGDASNGFYFAALNAGAGEIAHFSSASRGIGDPPDIIFSSNNGAPSALARDADGLYWTLDNAAPNGSVMSYAFAEKVTKPVATNLDHPARIAVDGRHLYVTTRVENGEVLRFNTDGSDRTTIAGPLDHPESLVVDDAVYFATATSIEKTPK